MSESGAAPWSGRAAHAATWMLAAVVACAVGLRVWGISFGLPYLYYPDEPNIVSTVQHIFKTGDLNPHFFDYPSLFLYLNALAYVPYYLVGLWRGAFHSLADIPAPLTLAMGVGQTPLAGTFLLGRALTATFGATTVVVVFLAGRRLTGSPATGLLAALMLAVSPANVMNSRFITPDAFLTFFVVLTLWAAVGVYQQGQTWHYLLAGGAAGLAAASKYNGALIIVAFVTAHLLRCGARGLKDPKLYMALALSPAVFLLASPYVLLDHATFFADFQFRHYATGHPGMEGATLSWYLAYLWRIEGPLSLLALVEMGRGIYRRSRQTFLLAAFPLVYFAFVSSLAVRNDRTLMPLLPFLFLLASSLLMRCARVGLGRAALPTSSPRTVASAPDGRWGRALSPGARRLFAAAAVAVILLSLALPLRHTIESTIELTTVDSRETARVWMADHLPAGARVAVESYAAFVDPRRFALQPVTRFSLIEHDAAWYAAQGVEYVVFGEGMFGRFFLEPRRYAQQVAQYNELFRCFALVRAFDDGGYEVRVYRVPTPAALRERLCGANN